MAAWCLPFSLWGVGTWFGVSLPSLPRSETIQILASQCLVISPAPNSPLSPPISHCVITQAPGPTRGPVQVCGLHQWTGAPCPSQLCAPDAPPANAAPLPPFCSCLIKRRRCLLRGKVVPLRTLGLFFVPPASLGHSSLTSPTPETLSQPSSPASEPGSGVKPSLQCLDRMVSPAPTLSVCLPHPSFSSSCLRAEPASQPASARSSARSLKPGPAAWSPGTHPRPTRQ